MRLQLQQRGTGSLRTSWMAAGVVLLAFGLWVAALFDATFSDYPLILLTLPLALAALAFGIRGGLAMASVDCALALVWWLHESQPGGIAWIGSRMLIYVVIGGVIGRVVDSRAELLRRLSDRNELSLDLIATASFDGYFTSVNPAFSRTLGYAAEELMARPLFDFIHPDDREPTLQAVRDQTDRGLEIFEFQNRYSTKDGSYRWLEWCSRPDARAKELVAVARDVTDRKRLEEAEHQHTQLLEQAVQARTRQVRERNRELEDARRETLRRLALAAEYRDDDTHQHTERIGVAAARVATALGWPDADVRLIRDAAPLHDVGKLGVSDSILLKPGKLTAAEFDLVNHHPETGAAILTGSDSLVLQMAEAIALGHHEWWDGSGYPFGRAGEAIPTAARIVAIVDVFDALTHERPYKRAWPVDEAVAEIERLRELQFDPMVVDAFIAADPYTLVDLAVDRIPRPNIFAVA
jgi:PAS domain S-box-containing protein